MASITRTTSNGHVFTIDEEDAPLVDTRSWYAEADTHHIYIRTHGCGPNKYSRLHRLLLAAPKGTLVDHINGDGRDNRRINLRLCSPAENARNTRRHRDSKSPYKGVRVHPDIGRKARFQATIYRDQRRCSLGYFTDAESAARAYDAAAKQTFGAFAHLNFPEPHAQ